jgi:hypothetical protein
MPKTSRGIIMATRELKIFCGNSNRELLKKSPITWGFPLEMPSPNFSGWRISMA